MTTENKADEADQAAIKANKTVESDAKNPKPIGVLGAWLRSETFWQGVAASTTSTGIVATGAVFAALMTGLVDLGSAIVTLISFAVVILLAVLGVWAIPAARSALKGIKSAVNEDANISLTGIVITLFVAIAALVGAKAAGL